MDTRKHIAAEKKRLGSHNCAQAITTTYADFVGLTPEVALHLGGAFAAGMGNMEYVKKQFIAAQLQAQQRIGRNHYVLLRFAAGQQADKLKEIFDNRTLLGGQIAYYYNTIFGPVGASFGYSNHTKKPYFFLNLGYEF